MKIYKKIIIDKNNKIIFENSFEYNGPLSRCGIHYDYKSTRAAKAMQKKMKREKKLAARREKKQVKSGIEKQEEKTISLDHVITLDDLTRPDKK